MSNSIRVADYVANRLYELGVGDIFTITGGGSMFLNDGVASHPNLRVICNHHEQASAMGAVAYARYRNDFGVVMTTTGCGSTNAITGLLDAWQDNIPCIFISGQANKDQTIQSSGLPLRQVGVQEANIVEIVKSITKYAVMITDPNTIGYHLDKAIYLAKDGRPGPVWLDIPLDVQGSFIDPSSLPRFSESEVEKQFAEELSSEDAASLKQLFAQAERPVVLAGNGIRLANAIPEFLRFVEQYNVPFVTTHLGIDLVPSDHPLNIGRVGVKGDRAGNFTIQNSDLVLGIGTRLSVNVICYRKENFARGAKIAVVDIDPIEHRKPTARIDLLINADAKRFLEDIKLGNSKTQAWVETCQGWRDKWPVCLPEYENDKEGINIYYFVEQLSRISSPDAVMVTDAGTANYAMAQGFRVKGTQRMLLPGSQGELGFSIPGAIGVSVARSKGEAIGVTGDGSFNTNIQELQTIVHNKLPVKLFILNNDGYLSNRAAQKRYFEGRYIGADKDSGVSTPDIRKIADAYGIEYFQVAKVSDLEATTKSALEHPGPVICEVMCPKWQEIAPTLGGRKTPEGKITARPAEDMAPFLDREEFFGNMIVAPLGESSD